MKKMTIGLVITLVLAALSVCSFAYYLDYKEKSDEIKVSTSKIEIIEESISPKSEIIEAGMELGKSVKIRNHGDRAFVRCLVEYSDSRYEEASEIDYNVTDWQKEGRYWYYNKPIECNETTEQLMSKIHFNKEMPSGFEVIVYAESVQAEGYNDARGAFESIS